MKTTKQPFNTSAKMVKTTKRHRFLALLQHNLLHANSPVFLALLTVSFALCACTQDITNNDNGEGTTEAGGVLRPFIFKLGVDNAKEIAMRSTTNNTPILPTYNNQVNVSIDAQQLEDVMPQYLDDTTPFTLYPSYPPTTPTRGAVIKENLAPNAQLRAWAYSGENADSHMCDTNNVVTCKDNKIEMMVNWPAKVDTARFCFIYPVKDSKMSQINYKDKKLCFTYKQTDQHSDKQNDVLCNITAVNNNHTKEINLGTKQNETLNLYHPLSAFRVEKPVEGNEFVDLQIFKVKKDGDPESEYNTTMINTSCIYFKAEELPDCLKKSPATMKLFKENNIKTYGDPEIQYVTGEDGEGIWNRLISDDEEEEEEAPKEQYLYGLALSDFKITKIELRGVQPQGSFVIKSEYKSLNDQHLQKRTEVKNVSGDATTYYITTNDSILCTSKIDEQTTFYDIKVNTNEAKEAANRLKEKTLFLIPQPLTDNMELRIYYQYKQTIKYLNMHQDEDNWTDDIKLNVKTKTESIVKGAKRILLKKFTDRFENTNPSTANTSNLLPNYMYRILLTNKNEESWTINPEKCIIGDAPTKPINQK